MARSGSVARTSLRNVSANASGRWLVRVDDKNVAGVAIKERQINRALSLRFRELRLFYRADDPDNGEQFRLVGIAALKDTLTERAALRPVAPRKIFVHDTDSFRAVRIRRGQEPTFAQRNAERGEVIARDAIGIMTVQRFARLRHIVLRCDRAFAVVSAQRHVRDRSGGGDSRLLTDCFQQAIEDGDALG